MTHSFSNENRDLPQELERLTGENVMLCSQCGKCTPACPSAYAMRMKPDELMRAVQLGMKEEVFWSGAIWTCVSCGTCSSQCIEGIDVLRVMDGLRQMAFSKSLVYYNPFPAVPGYHRLFLLLLNRLGRVYEIALILLNNLKMLTPFKDIDLIAALLRKRKLSLFPPSGRGRRELRRLMGRIREMEGIERVT